MEARHFWQGEWITDAELESRMERLGDFTDTVLGAPFPLEQFLELCQRMHEALDAREPIYERLLSRATQTREMSREKAAAMLETVSAFLRRDRLRKKLRRELGSDTPFEIARPSFREEPFESWAPMGILVHIAPTNVFTIGILAVIEGLLAGNVNILKSSASQRQLPQLFFEALLALDRGGLLRPYVIILDLSSRRRELLERLVASADAVSAWGSEEAIASIRRMTPDGVRFVAWGHKISFAYFAKERLDDEEAMRKVCEDVCLLDQNACSSPQDVFVECDDMATLTAFAKRFAAVLRKVAAESPRTEPSPAQQAEITTHLSVARTEMALGLTHVIEDEAHEWAVIADRRGGLGVSPLFRTVLVRPLPEAEIVPTLHPMKRYLQTVGLVAPRERILPLSRRLFGAGCLRVRRPGEMHGGYVGEPHDGVYALPSFMKRISVDLGETLEGVGTFRAFEETLPPELGDAPVMEKSDFQAMAVDPRFIDLTFESGGSSGHPTFSYYTYDDYRFQMHATAAGLYDAGLDPRSDRVINLLAAGHLYGGFLSFFSILERLEAPQYPMGTEEALDKVGELIVAKGINVVISVPTLIVKLFEVNAERFEAAPTVTKVFFGGDRFSRAQRRWLRERFGVETIRAIYGSNDAGPMGYQCPHCGPDEYHLLSGIQYLEVFDPEADRPVEPGTPGRLLFTSLRRTGQSIVRYDVGDMGYLHARPCPCGRKDPKFTLLGRRGDLFKAGGPFLNYRSFLRILEEAFGYTGLLQIVLENSGTGIRIRLRTEAEKGPDPSQVRERLLRDYEALEVSVETLGADFVVEAVPEAAFERIVRSGKIPHLIDRRT